VRGRRSVALDLKAPEAVAACLDLIARADVLVEGFRPGVMERLGLGPEAALARNPKLVYGRMTGWGQDGPLSQTAGHDIDYLSISGALSAIGTADKPVPPLNLVADFGGGAMFLVMGVLAAVVHVRGGGEGQVVDAAMTEGAALLTTMFHGMRAAGIWSDRRAANLLDGGAPFYDTYRTADGGWLGVGCIEPQFYAEFVGKLEIDPETLPHQMDASQWPATKARFAEVIAGRTRAEWEAVFEGSDACVAPVLGLGEAAAHPHNVARQAFVEVDGVVQPGPAPRFSRTPGAVRSGTPAVGAHTAEVLREWGVAAERIAALAPLPG
jgi:alpha-methylacyl-CoA racemase